MNRYVVGVSLLLALMAGCSEKKESTALQQLPLDLAANEAFDPLARHVVGELPRRMLHDVRRDALERPGETAVERDGTQGLGLTFVIVRSRKAFLAVETGQLQQAPARPRSA